MLVLESDKTDLEFLPRGGWLMPADDGPVCTADPFDDFEEDDFDDDFDDDFEEEWDEELPGDNEFQTEFQREDGGGDLDFDDD